MDEWLRQAISSGDLVRALGGTGRDGSGRDLEALLRDIDSALEHDIQVMTVEQVAYRLDLDRFTTRRVLDDLRVPHSIYVNAAALRVALVAAAVREP